MILNHIYRVTKIWAVDYWWLVFYDETNTVVLRKYASNYSKEFLASLPGYYCCVRMEDGDILIRDRALVVRRSEWNKIPADYKGKYADYDGRHPELRGRNTVLGGCIGGVGSELLVEGVHFVIL